MSACLAIKRERERANKRKERREQRRKRRENEGETQIYFSLFLLVSLEQFDGMIQGERKFTNG